MLAREVDAIVQVPGDFSRRLAAGNAQVQLLVHGSEASRALIIRGYVSGALGQWAQQPGRSWNGDGAGRGQCHSRFGYAD